MTDESRDHPEVSLLRTTLRLLELLGKDNHNGTHVVRCVARLVSKSEAFCSRELIDEEIQLCRTESDREKSGLCLECGGEKSNPNEKLCSDCIRLTEEIVDMIFGEDDAFKGWRISRDKMS
jgi:hypothetical protein